MNIHCPSCSKALSVAGGHARVQCPFCRTVIDLGAGAAPPSGSSGEFSRSNLLSSLAAPGTAASPRTRRRSSGSGMQMIVVACVLLILVGGGAFIGLTMLRTGPQKEQAGDVKQPPAVLKAQDAVSQYLGASIKPQFDKSPKVRPTQENEWTIDSQFQYRDRAGKLWESKYSARVKQEAPNEFRVESLEVGGRMVTLASSNPPPDVKDPSDNTPVTPMPEVPRDDRSVRRALQQLGSVVDEAATLRKTLVVWLFDASPSAEPLRGEVVSGFDMVASSLRKHKAVPAKDAKESPVAKSDPAQSDPGKSAAAQSAADKSADAKLQMAVMAFDDEISVVSDQPLSDEKQLREALGKISQGKGGHERPFGALQKGLEKFGDFAKQGGRLQFIVVTDEAGDDEEKVIEATIPALKKAGVQVYVIGREAPLGRSAYPEGNGRFNSAPVASADPLHQGPESLFSERIKLQFFGSGFGDKFFDIPSGFGPYQLCRVCAQTDGTYFVCEGQGSGQLLGGWDSGNASYAFTPANRARYAPKYLSADEYRKQIAGNKALQGLHEAAKLPEFDLVQTLAVQFGSGGNEAQLKQQLDRSQQGVARTEPKLKEIADLLLPGASDRAKITEPRLQAAYDLAAGRILAAQARIEGYNAMLAILKGGKRFKNSGSTVWVLEAADTTGAGSKFAKAITDAHTYLERVIKDHPNTPWAYFAQRELQAKMGWEWGER